MKIPYRYRGLALLALLLAVLPGAAWRLALRDTFVAWRDCRSLTRGLAVAERCSEASDPASGLFSAAPELVLSGRLLDSVRQCAPPGVEVAGYVPATTRREAGIAVRTAQITLTGGYAGLLRTLHALEGRLSCCRVRSVGWQAVVQPRTRHRQLVLTLYVQQPTLISDEYE